MCAAMDKEPLQPSSRVRKKFPHMMPASLSRMRRWIAFAWELFALSGVLKPPGLSSGFFKTSPAIVSCKTPVSIKNGPIKNGDFIHGAFEQCLGFDSGGR